MKDLGIDPVPALVGFIWKEQLEATDSARIAAFLSAVGEANALLLAKDEPWERLRPIVKPASDGEFKALIASYRSGIPQRPWGAGETASAAKLMQVLVEAGDAELMGKGTHFDAKLFHNAAS
jgi:NitT/TauT family transport system substrate-binding protein